MRILASLLKSALVLLLITIVLPAQQPSHPMNPYLELMQKAAAHASSHRAKNIPALSPIDASILDGSVPVTALHAQGIRIIPWTTNDPEKMRAVIRTGVDGLISDRPDLLQKVLAEERAVSPEAATRLKTFNVSGHRGGRNLHPENTLPAFEGGLDNLIDTIETDTGVTSDLVSLIWHDQFLNPESCRRADGKPYTQENRVYIRDISLAEAQATFICDKLHRGPAQKNDLNLSPVAVAFAEHEHLISPYVPTYVEQLFRFTAFYADFYRKGTGKSNPSAEARAKAADRVQFNLETKILPDFSPPRPNSKDPKLKLPAEILKNRTVSPQVFVDTLCGAIQRNHMESRSDVQSFDFRTLILVEEQYPGIPTYYLTEDALSLTTGFVPASLRVAKP